MESKLTVDILPQPDNFTCGPTCLHAVYRYHGDCVELAQVISEVGRVAGGGTLDVLLGCHALRRGYDATIYTYNVQLFDPTWFEPDADDIAERLRRQMEHKPWPILKVATRAYLEFLELGGRLRFEDLTGALIRKYLNRSIPVLTGLSATYLHHSAREYGPACEEDDVRGEPAGHFVVLCGYDKESRGVLVADPLETNPVSGSNRYVVSIDRVIGAILLGIVTYDANLLIIEPREKRKQGSHAGPDRR
ncbi:MAG: C39 family peptidase [Planctomycetia bacterium]|nr:C39 family peptidase [Planctomycetia bacterium]